MYARLTRRMWHLFEPIHDVVYFAPECIQAASTVGLRGFWMGYFAFRFAPLGEVPADVVFAGCYGFPRQRVTGAIPDAWSYATPAAALRARAESSATALKRVWGADIGATSEFQEAADLLWSAARLCRCEGRLLAQANQELPEPDCPVERLWQAATTLREHRGTGHVAALLVTGVGPVECHAYKIAAGESDEAQLRIARNYSDAEWESASQRLQRLDHVGRTGRLTATGAALRAEVERLTDRAAAGPWEELGADRTQRLRLLLEPLTARVWASGVLRELNPVGVGDHKLRD